MPPNQGVDPVEGFSGAWGVEEGGGMQRRKPNGRANAGNPRVPSDGSNGPSLVPTRNTSRTSSASMPRYARGIPRFDDGKIPKAMLDHHFVLLVLHSNIDAAGLQKNILGSRSASAVSNVSISTSAMKHLLKGALS